MRWVRPDLTTSFHSSAFRSRDSARWARAGSRCSTTPAVTATCTEVGNTSLLDCEQLTWSLGWVSVPASVARVARTSFMFMFELVPEPVW